ncbi:MAG: hypothetical protein K0U98_00010 [Deltaproteobacteria bacterium]|nr:hypothetical protein [Deltaproteobacteria bacterium]
MAPFILATFLQLFVTKESCAVESTHQIAYRYPHVWRGITLRDFPVLNISSTFSFDRGLSLQVWAGLDLSDGDGRAGEVQEIDIDLYYQRQRGRWDVRFGYIGLIFPGGIDPTGEAYAQIGANVPGSPRLEVYYNVDLLQDLFALFHVQENWRLSEKWQASWVGTLGISGREYARFFGATESGFHHWSTHLDLRYALRNHFITFRLAYTENLDNKVLRDQPVSLWGGIYFSWKPSLSKGR